MAQSIDSFVSKLQEEGVQAGEKKARLIEDAAAKQAEKIQSDAQSKADKIIADAKAEGENIVSRGKTELQLAARDTVLKLRQTLSSALQTVLTRATGEALADADFLKTALAEITRQYAESDAKGDLAIQINLSDEMKGKLGDWAISQLGQNVDLQGTLGQAGFEYKAGGANVEVTTEAVVDTLAPMVSQRLKDVIAQAINETSGE